MGWGIPAAIIGGQLIGSLIGSESQQSAAESAAQASMYGADQSAAVQRYMFDKMMELQQPYYQAGTSALPALLGFDPTGTGASLLPATTQAATTGGERVGPIIGYDITPAQEEYRVREDRPMGVGVTMGGTYYPIGSTVPKDIVSQYLPSDVPAENWFNVTNVPEVQTPIYGPYEGDISRTIPEGVSPATGSAADFMSQLQQMPALSLPEFDYAFDPNDPAYQFKLSEAQKAIDAFTASRGGYASRAAGNLLTEAQRAITAEEVGSQFERAKDIYGLEYGRAQDIYGSQYGKLLDLYNMGTQIGLTDYNKLLDIVKIGQGAAASAGSGALATGQGLAQTYGQLGSNLANIAMMKGQTQSDLWSGMGTLPLNYLLMSNLMGGGSTGSYSWPTTTLSSSMSGWIPYG